MNWLRGATGDLVAFHNGSRWRVRRAPMTTKEHYWLYRDGSRVTTTGRYEDALFFSSVREAQTHAEKIAASQE